MPALILDCDGVLAETERHLHLPSFNRAFAEFGIPVHWSEDEYADKLLVNGGKERMATSITPELVAAHGLSGGSGDLSGLLERLHARKRQIFAELLEARALPARPGVARIIGAASAAGWRVAVASTSAEPTVRAVLRQVVGHEQANGIAVFAGDIAHRKKPAPEIYELALEGLGTTASEAIAIEDSRNGLLAAHAAGLPCVVTISDYSAGEAFDEAALVLSSLGDPGEPMTVVANRTAARPDEYVRLSDLEAILRHHQDQQHGRPRSHGGTRMG